MYAVNAAWSKDSAHGLPAARVLPLALDRTFSTLRFYSSYDAQGNVSPTATALFDTSYVNPIAGISDFWSVSPARDERRANAFRGPGQWHFDLGAAKNVPCGGALQANPARRILQRTEPMRIYLSLVVTPTSSGANFVDAVKGGNGPYPATGTPI